jgi:hypothetical protein
MKLERIFVAFMAFFIGLAFVYLFAKNTDNGVNVTAEALANENLMQTRAVTFDSKSTGSMGSGDALVELTPATVGRERLILKFIINTHSVRLNGFDLKQITTLEYKGKELKPVKASRIGGHHSSGTIEFTTGEEIGSFIIRIKGIPRVEERVFEWNV